MNIERRRGLNEDVFNGAKINSTDYAQILNVNAQWGTVNMTKDVADQSQKKEPEHLIHWIVGELKDGIKMIPKKAKILSIYGGVILAINLIFWTVKPYFLPSYLQPFRQLISLVVFLTATYNDIVPKTIFWVIVFTFGRKLFKQMRKRGFRSTFSCMKNTVPQLSKAMSTLGSRAYPILLSGAGMGLIIANNFASYSRFSGARNKIDKYFIVMIIAFSISYLLGEANKTGIFKFIKLGSNDLGKLIGIKQGLSDDGVYLILSGFVLGLLLDAPLIFLKFMYGGYILGLLGILVAIVMLFIPVNKATV
ncbi:hypothetical protein QE109_11450 [Fusibacter bizertensis]|uniref:Uncharacterized protein n=1 Tax=Fusibacter bizertensis TaxID=1488331 RepID=A0ABT6NEB9_9FIRM|nr:hypothetical protein [Fusibacter bizertensis]MDH8678768.1 hypothetical protein [Fusibacter bizertensis]